MRLALMAIALGLCTMGNMAQSLQTFLVDQSQVTILGPDTGSFEFFAQPLLAADLDGDGYDEVITSASSDFSTTPLNRVYIFRGGEDFLERGVIDLDSDAADLVIQAAQSTDVTASALAVGDVNGDTRPDLLIASPAADLLGRTFVGAVYVIFGSDTLFDSPEISLSDSGSWDLRLVGNEAGANMGGAGDFGGTFDATSLAVGNLNGDQYGDIVVGSHLSSPIGAFPYGRVFVVFGENFTSGTSLDMNVSGATGRDIQIIGHGDGDEIGEVVETADLDGDGLDELILGSYYESRLGAFSSEGRVHIWKGRTSGWPTQFDLRTTNSDISIRGTTAHDGVGSILVVGDFNGDTIDDLAIGADGDEIGSAPDPNEAVGLIHVYLGGSRFQVSSASLSIDANPADLVVVGLPEDGAAAYPSAAGDINSDGFDELMIAQRDAFSQLGAVDIVMGRADFSSTPVIDFSASEHDFRILGVANRDMIGCWVSSGDVNGDGVDEVLMGSSFSDSDRGSVWVMDVLASFTPVSQWAVWR